MEVFNTICEATEIRQKEAAELAAKVDCIFVVGGYNSANTNRLADICRKINPKTYYIEVEGEIDLECLEGVEKVGITAGASTPLNIIHSVKKKIMTFGLEPDV